MGANVQFSSYFPGCYAPRNLSLDATGSAWPQNHGVKISESGNFCNAFLSPEYLLAYNKELLKQTMLKHETIFKDQIQELHRLYRRQRELMDEIQRNESGAHYVRYNESNSNVAFSQAASMYVQKNCHVPGFPLMNLPSSQMSVSGPESIRSPLSLVQGTKAQACPSYPAVKAEACTEDIQLLEAKCRKVGKKILDLQLPADEYIDCDDIDEKVSERPKGLSYSVNRSPEVVYTSDVKSFFGSNLLSSVFCGTNATPALVLENQKQSLDQNVPTKLEERATCLSNGYVGPTSHSNLLCHELSGKTSAVFQSSLEEAIQNTQKRPDRDVLANFIPSVTGRKQEQQSYHDKTGKYGSKLNSFLQGFDADNIPSSSKLASKDLEEAFRPPTLEQGNQRLYSERTIYGLESCRRISDPPNGSLNGPRHGAPSQSIFDDHSSLIKKNSESTLTLRELCDSGRNPIAVQALPCFITSVPLGTRYKQSVGKPGLSGDNNLVHDSNGLKEHNDSRNFPSLPDANWNSNQPRWPSVIRVSEGIHTSQGEEKHEYSDGMFSWIRANSAHKGKENTGLVSLAQVESVSLRDYSAGNHDLEPKKAETTGFSSKWTPVSDDDNRSFISAHNFASISNPSKTCRKPSSDVKSKGKCTVLDLNMACDSLLESESELTVDEHAVENRVDSKDTGFGCPIDLNSPINEAEFSEKPSLKAENDLDAPSSPENKECSPPRGESETNHVETPLLSSGQDDVDPQDEIARIAAEAIVSLLSFNSSTALQNTSSKDLGASSHDSLLWFANIVSSVSSDSANEIGLLPTDKKNDYCRELLPDDMDYFEAMTLNLAEAKPEEISYKSNPSKEEETGTSSSPSQQRKGRARRGRQQRKDFQREILPSLASLSRYEVTEDLQTIGGLMEAAGAHWETGSTRYAARNRCSRAQKRSPLSGSNTVVGLGCSAVSLLKQISSSSNSTVGKEERSVICWGKVTKRPRGQRYPGRVRNQQLILSQV